MRGGGEAGPCSPERAYSVDSHPCCKDGEFVCMDPRAENVAGDEPPGRTLGRSIFPQFSACLRAVNPAAGVIYT